MGGFELYTRKVVQGSLKCASYWQSVLRFGLPWIVGYRIIHYTVFRIYGGNASKYFSYPWSYVLRVDFVALLIVSTVWWGFMRQIASWKPKD
jgi:hypothetical protein